MRTKRMGTGKTGPYSSDPGEAVPNTTRCSDGSGPKVRDLRFEYPGFRLEISSLELDRQVPAVGGGYTAITGPNGSGKTTLARLLCGLLSPTRGEIVLGGKSTGSWSIADFSRHCAYVYQNPELMFFTESVTDEISFGPRNAGLPGKEIEEKVDDLCRLFRIEHLKERHPFLLSRGEQQRLAAACVMAMTPPFIFFDEATKGLDGRTRDAFLDILEGLEDCHPVLISNDFHVLRRAVRVIALRNGRIAADGGPGMLFTNEFYKRTGLEVSDGMRLARTLGVEYSPDITVFSDRVGEVLPGNGKDGSTGSTGIRKKGKHEEVHICGVECENVRTCGVESGDGSDRGQDETGSGEPGVSGHGNTRRGKLDPRTRFIMVIILSTAALLATSLVSTFAVLSATVILLAASRVGRADIQGHTRGILNMLFFIFMVQAIFTPGERLIIPDLFPMMGGLPTLSIPGIERGIIFSSKLLAVVLASVYFNAVTPSSEFLVAARQMHLPYAFAFMVNIVLRFIPGMMEDMNHIMEAQQARGLELSRRNYRKRMRNLIFIVKPLVLSYLLKARKLAMAMEARGFRVGAERTNMVELRMGVADYATIAGTLAFAAACFMMHIS